MIDEKELIEEIKSFRMIVTGIRVGKGILREFEKRYKESILRIIDDQPKVGEWIPVSEYLPKEYVPVNVTWINRNPEPYYEKIKNVRFSDTAVYCNGRWFWWSATCVDLLKEYGKNDIDLVDKDIDVIAWMPLPKPFEGEQK